MRKRSLIVEGSGKLGRFQIYVVAMSFRLHAGEELRTEQMKTGTWDLKRDKGPRKLCVCLHF